LTRQSSPPARCTIIGRCRVRAKTALLFELHFPFNLIEELALDDHPGGHLPQDPAFEDSDRFVLRLATLPVAE
jgi:hypothetical protein